MCMCARADTVHRKEIKRPSCWLASFSWPCISFTFWYTCKGVKRPTALPKRAQLCMCARAQLSVPTPIEWLSFSLYLSLLGHLNSPPSTTSVIVVLCNCSSSPFRKKHTKLTSWEARSTSDAWISMDGKTPHLLPLSLSQAKKKIRDDAVPLVCGWALFNACAIACGLAAEYIAHHYHFVCSKSFFILPCIEMTNAEVARDSAVRIGMLCCAPSQAAAAALALLLPCRRRWARRALAYLALAVTVLYHCIIMYASSFWLFLAADPGHIFGRIFFTVIICFMVVCDLLSCLALLLGGDGRRKQHVAC